MSVATGAQESWPEVPDSKDDQIILCIKENKLKIGDPIFVLDSYDLKKLKQNLARPLTPQEKSSIRPFLKTIKEPQGFRIHRQKSMILFMDKSSTHNLSEDEFKEIYPHIHKWLLKFKPLLLCDIDRRERRRKWWMLHRSCDERPDAKSKCGVDFRKRKIIVNQFLSNEIIAFLDDQGHITSNMSSTCISARSCTEKNNKPSKLRVGWQSALIGWLNSFLIRDIWYRALNNAKIRGPKGEINVKHIEKTPIIEALLFESDNREVEITVNHLINIVDQNMSSATETSLVEIDQVVCTIFYEYFKPAFQENRAALSREKYLNALT